MYLGILDHLWGPDFVCPHHCGSPAVSKPLKTSMALNCKSPRRPNSPPFALFHPDPCIKKKKKPYLTVAKERPKAPKVEGVYSGLRPILHPLFFGGDYAEKATNKGMEMDESVTPLAALIRIMVTPYFRDHRRSKHSAARMLRQFLRHVSVGPRRDILTG